MRICRKVCVRERESRMRELDWREKKKRKKGTKSTERSRGTTSQKNLVKKEKRNSSNLEKSHPAFQSECGNSQTRELYLIWTGRVTENQAGREGVSYIVQCVNSTSNCLSAERVREQQTNSVTFPGIDLLIWIDGDGCFLCKY